MKYIGLDIGGTKIAVILAKDDGTILKRSEFETIFNASKALDKIITIIKSFNSDFDSIGISIGGPLDYNKQIILDPPNLKGWENYDIVKHLKKEFSVNIFLDNDANCCALAHKYWGEAKTFNNFAFLTFGTGFGSGLVLNNKIYHGKKGNSGEIGHIRISDTGSFNYGKNGSIESFCSGSGISNTYYDLTNTRLSAKQICIKAKENDKDALKVINNSAKYLGRAIAILVDLLDLEAVIIGSIFAKDYSLFIDKTRIELEKEALQVSLNDFKIIPSSLDNLQDLAPIAICVENNRG